MCPIILSYFRVGVNPSVFAGLRLVVEWTGLRETPMQRSIVERMSGKMDDGCYVTIDAAARHLGLRYRQTQRLLREAHLGGDLVRAKAGRKLLYSSKQRSLF